MNASVPDESLADQAYDAAEAEIEATVSEIRSPLPYRLGLPGGGSGGRPFPEPVSNTSRERYLEMVRQAKDYVAAGDIIQVVPSQRFETPAHRPPLRLLPGAPGGEPVALHVLPRL